MNRSITISNSEKLSFVSNLATMYNAGIPILETIESMTEDSKGNTRKILVSINADLVQGESMYTAFSKFPGVFNKVTVNVIRASEEAGTLDVVLKDVKNQIQKDMEFMDSVKSAVTYPLIIFLLFIGVFVMILVVVVPKISTIFISLKVKLSLPTQILISLSNLILHQTILLLIVLTIIAAFFVLLYKKQKSMVLSVLFSFPVVSTLVKEIDLARFSRSMYLLLSSGITITNALDLAKDVVLRRDVKKIIMNANQDVLAGKKLSDAFKKKKEFFPGIVIKIIEAGEKTGTLDKSMEEISNFMDYRVSATLKKLITLMEPLMLVFVGFMVGAMMFSIISPIYGLISQVGGR
jgi:type II secretory pathway component PulF